MQFLINRNGQQFGPYTIEQIRSYLAAGQLLPTDMAWREGMPAWQPVSQILGTAPPPPPPAYAPPPASPYAPAPPQGYPAPMPGYGAPAPMPNRKSGSTARMAVWGLLLVACVLGGLWYWATSEPQVDTVVETDVESKYKAVFMVCPLIGSERIEPGARALFDTWPISTNIANGPASTCHPDSALPSSSRVVSLAYSGQGNRYDVVTQADAGATGNKQLFSIDVELPPATSHPLDTLRYWDVEVVSSIESHPRKIRFTRYLDGPASSSGGFKAALRSFFPGGQAGDWSAVSSGAGFIGKGSQVLTGSTDSDLAGRLGKPARILSGKDGSDEMQMVYYDGLFLMRKLSPATSGPRPAKTLTLRIHSPRFKLWKDLGVGASASDYKAVLGKPVEETSALLTFMADPTTYRSPRLQVFLENGKSIGLQWLPAG